MLLGASRIVLLGYDMRFIDGKKHWHEDHRDRNPSASQLRGWADNFATMLPDLARAGVDVINCTPGSALNCFAMARIEDAL